MCIIYMCSSYCYMLACIGYYVWNGWKIDINKDRLQLQQETIIGRGSCNCDIYMLTANIRHQIYTNSNSTCLHMYYMYNYVLFIYTLVIWLTWYIPIIRQYYWGYPALIGNGIAARRTVTLRAKRFDSRLAPAHPPENCNQGLYLNEWNHMPIPTLNNIIMGIEIPCYTCNDSLIFYFLRNQTAERSMDHPGHSQVCCSCSLMFSLRYVTANYC